MSDENQMGQPDRGEIRPTSLPAPIEHATEEEQDRHFDEMVRAYANPAPEIQARYAEIGRQTRAALERG